MQREYEEALKMVRLRWREGMRTTEQTLSTSLCWRPSHAHIVTVKLLNLGYLDEHEGALLLTESGRRFLS